MIQAVGARISPNLLAPNAPIFSEDRITKESQNDEEAGLVLHQLNAQKPVDRMYEGPGNLQVGDVNGYVAHLQRGSLGLVKVESA